jgi:antitoxin VapB
MAYANTDIDLEITRVGEVITIFPARTGLVEAVAALRRMPRPPIVEEREPIEVPLGRCPESLNCDQAARSIR